MLWVCKRIPVPAFHWLAIAFYVKIGAREGFDYLPLLSSTTMITGIVVPFLFEEYCICVSRTCPYRSVTFLQLVCMSMTSRVSFFFVFDGTHPRNTEGGGDRRSLYPLMTSAHYIYSWSRAFAHPLPPLFWRLYFLLRRAEVCMLVSLEIHRKRYLIRCVKHARFCTPCRGDTQKWSPCREKARSKFQKIRGILPKVVNPAWSLSTNPACTVLSLAAVSRKPTCFDVNLQLYWQTYILITFLFCVLSVRKPLYYIAFLYLTYKFT